MSLPRRHLRLCRDAVWQSCSWPRGSLRQSQHAEERLEENVLENKDPGPWDSLDLEKESSTSPSRQRDLRQPVCRDEVSVELSSSHWQLQKQQQLLQRHPLSHLLLPRERQVCKTTRAALTLPSRSPPEPKLPCPAEPPSAMP